MANKTLALVLTDQPECLYAIRQALDGACSAEIVSARSPEEVVAPGDKSFAAAIIAGASEGHAVQLATRLRAISQYRHVPIIFLKPRGLPPEPFDGFEHAPVDFMTSPWDPGTLATKVSTFVTVARLKQEALLSEQAMEVMALELRSTHERLASKERELSTVTALDKLTGLPNRLRMAETLHSEWLRMTREGKSLAMLFIDVDHLRLFQEHYGQGAEERCLRRIAMALDGAFRRPGDILGRFGAEKFGAILPDTDIAGTKHIAEAACAAVRGLDIEHAASPVSNVVTVSVGAGSVRPGPGCTAADLIQAADKALYKAKLAGRDKVAYSDCEPEACVST